MNTLPIYFIQDMRGRVKIGYASSVTDRLNVLQGGNADPLFVMRVAAGYFAAERWYHARFAHKHLVREWFDFDHDMMSATAPEEIAHLLPPRFRGWKEGNASNEPFKDFEGLFS